MTDEDAVIGIKCLMCEDFLPRPIEAEDLTSWIKSDVIQAYLEVHHHPQGGHSLVVQVYSGLPRYIQYDC